MNYLQGPEGERGPRGKDGIQGPKGDKGDKGDPGRDGKDGRDGRDGKDAQIEPPKLWSAEFQRQGGKPTEAVLLYADERLRWVIVPEYDSNQLIKRAKIEPVSV